MRGCGRVERPAFPAPSEFQMRLTTDKTRADHAARSRRCGCVNCPRCHCEEQRDEAIQLSCSWCQIWIASLALAMTVHKRIAALSSLSLRTVQRHRGSYPSSREAVGRVAHRERSERCGGWGWFTDSNVGRDYTMDEPPPGASRHPPHKRGRDRKELAMTSQAVHTHPRLRDLAAQFRASFADVKPSEIQRAQGMPGARRTRSLMCKNKKHTR